MEVVVGCECDGGEKAGLMPSDASRKSGPMPFADTGTVGRAYLTLSQKKERQHGGSEVETLEAFIHCSLSEALNIQLR